MATIKKNRFSKAKQNKKDLAKRLKIQNKITKPDTKNLDVKPQSLTTSLKSLGQSLRSLLFFFLLLYLIPQIENWIGQDNIKNFINSGGIFAPIIFVFVRIITVVIAPLKLGPLSIILHRVFGFWPSVFFAMITVVVGSGVNLLISRIWGNKIIGFFFGSDILRIVDKYAQKYFNRSLLNDFFLFVSNYELASYASGLTNISLKKVITASSLSSLITAPMLILRDLSIGVNDLLATALFIIIYITSLAPVLYIAWGDISVWWKAEMKRISQE